MGAKLSVDECTSTENQHVRDCCHLEGETPVEIRIAYQQPRPPQRIQGFAHSGGAFTPDRTAAGFNAAGVAHGRHAAAHHGYHESYGGNPTLGSGQQWSNAAGDAEKPSMPRGADRLRFPPPGGGNRPQAPPAVRRQGGQQCSDDFDPDTFAAPPDSERADCSGTAHARMQHAAAVKALDIQQNEDYFPEIVRVGSSSHREGGQSHRGGSQNTPRSSSKNTATSTPREANTAR